MPEQEIAGCYCDVVHMTCSACRKRTEKRKELASIPGLNIYRHAFSATCPNDGDLILYKLEIRSVSIIWVEHIKTATALIKQGVQEQIADSLHKSLGGSLTLIGTHQGVEIESIRLAAQKQ